MRLYHFLAAGLVCSFLACQKEPDANLLTPSVCKLDAIYYYDDNNLPEDTVSYEYNGNQVNRVNYSDYYVELSYAAGLVVRRNYYLEGTTTLAAYDEFTYNGDSTLSKVDFYITDPSLPLPALLFEYSFTYSGGQLTQLTSKADTSGTGPVPFVEYYYTHSGNNITQVIERDLINQVADTLNYSYDGNQNYYSKNPGLWLSDNLFADFNGYLLPFALSVNNVTALTDNANNSSTVTYETTSRDDIQALSIDGDVVARYNYKCQ